MKKTFLLLLLAISISCSKSDSGTTPTNKIVGKWKEVESTIQTGINGTPSNHLQNCATLPVYDFIQYSDGKNGTVSWSAYNYDNNTSSCAFIGQRNSTWSDLGTDTYTLGNEEPNNVIFSNNNATMTISTNDGIYIIKTKYSKQN